jgi:hypothetical protein
MMAMLGFLAMLLLGGVVIARAFAITLFCKVLTGSFWGTKNDERLFVAAHWLFGVGILYFAITNAPFAITITTT